jgi:hypothetical protein
MDRHRLNDTVLRQPRLWGEPLPPRLRDKRETKLLALPADRLKQKNLAASGRSRRPAFRVEAMRMPMPSTPLTSRLTPADE